MQPKPQSLRDLREYPILYVDDEPDNLRIFELTFRRDFQILTAESGDRGLEIIQSEPVAIVLSDHRMPGMTGTQFLARVADVDPKTIRIMVTAYGDADTLRDAINDGSIYHFIPKPWDPDDVRATLLRAIEAYGLERERGQLLVELMVLHRVSAELNGQLEMGHLLGVLTSALRDELGFDGASVLLADARSGALRMVSQTTGDGAETIAAVGALEIGPRTAPELFKRLNSGRSQTLHIAEALDYPEALKGWVNEVAAEEILLTPVHGKDGLIGAIAVDNRRGGAAFSGDDGTLIEGLCNQAAIAIENARLVGELRSSREQVRRAERRGTLGTLAASLAHEINEPLSGIQAFLAQARDRRGDPDGTGFWGARYELACREVDRIRDLVSTLRRLGRSGTGGAAESLDVEEVAQEVASLLRRDARLAGVDLAVEADPDASKIVAVRDHVHQVVLNLALNALSVTPAGGAVRVLTRAAEQGEGVEIEVRDTGPGIPAEHLERIFDPFFSTKGGGEGAGLGLMICQRIVADHGGSIEVRNGPTSGASFVVRLPRERRALHS